MKAFLIDPEKHAITEVETDGSYSSVFDLIGADTVSERSLDDEGNFLLIDSERFFEHDGERKPDPEHFFLTEGHSESIGGKALVVREGANCETVETTLTMVDLVRRTRFLNAKRARDWGAGSAPGL